MALNNTGLKLDATFLETTEGLVENEEPKLRAQFSNEEIKLAHVMLTGGYCCFKMALISSAKIWPKLSWQLMQDFLNSIFFFYNDFPLLLGNSWLELTTVKKSKIKERPVKTCAHLK